MPIIVQKYGGTSLADADRIQNVARRVASRRAKGDEVVVVVSAMGSTTDDLLALAYRIARQPQERELDVLLSTGEVVSSPDGRELLVPVTLRPGASREIVLRIVLKVEG